MEDVRGGGKGEGEDQSVAAEEKEELSDAKETDPSPVTPVQLDCQSVTHGGYVITFAADDRF